MRAETGRIVASNARIAEMLGHPREYLAARIAEDLNRAPEPYSLTVARARILAAVSEGSAHFDWKTRHARGHLLWFDVRLLPFGPSSERLVLIVLRDIDEEKRGEEARREAEVRYREAQKLESLGLFAGGIAHDFNNLLVGVLGNADLALRDLEQNRDVRDTLRYIRQTAQSAALLTTQLLAYSGRGRFGVAPVDLATLVRRAVQRVDLDVDPRVSVRLRLDEAIPAVEADEAQLEEAITNLLRNAAHAVGEQDGEIMVRTARRHIAREELDSFIAGADLPEGEYVTVEITDTGRGMDEAVQRRAFDPFFSTKVSGRGMGLAAVLGIVRAHRGAIRVRSAPAEGATFLMILPGDQRPARVESVEATPDLEAWEPEGDVLVVDDTESVRDVARAILERKGFRVTTAVDGVDALENFEPEPQRFCLVLLDMTMPRLGGEATLQEMRRIREDVPIILCSGYDPQETAARFTDMKAVGFLQKPFQNDDMLLAVYKTLKG